MSIATAAVTVGSSATALYAADADASSVLVYNNGSSTIFVGGSDVTTSIGVPVAAGQSITFDPRPGEVLYGRVASGTVEARVMRSGVG